jgi:hypothetical protein
MLLNICRIHQSPLSRYSSHNSHPSFAPSLSLPNDEFQNLDSSMSILIRRPGLERTNPEREMLQ